MQLVQRRFITDDPFQGTLFVSSSGLFIIHYSSKIIYYKFHYSKLSHEFTSWELYIPEHLVHCPSTTLSPSTGHTSWRRFYPEVLLRRIYRRAVSTWKEFWTIDSKQFKKAFSRCCIFGEWLIILLFLPTVAIFIYIWQLMSINLIPVKTLITNACERWNLVSRAIAATDQPDDHRPGGRGKQPLT
jgi:hypothetical protein